MLCTVSLDKHSNDNILANTDLDHLENYMAIKPAFNVGSPLIRYIDGSVHQLKTRKKSCERVELDTLRKNFLDTRIVVNNSFTDFFHACRGRTDMTHIKRDFDLKVWVRSPVF